MKVRVGLIVPSFLYFAIIKIHHIYLNIARRYIKEYTYLGIVGETNEEGKYCISQRNKFSVGEQIEVMKPNGDNIEATVKSIQDEEGNQMESAPHPKQILYIDLGIKLDRYDILRRKEPVTEL